MSSASVAAVQKKRAVIFQQRFKLPASEELIADFLCALQQKILLQGRLYISQHYVCFYAKVFGNETVLSIPASDITGVSLAKSLGIVPNAIKLYTTYNTYWLGSFVKRQAAYDLLVKVSKGERLGREDVVMEPSQASHQDDVDAELSARRRERDDDDPEGGLAHDGDGDADDPPPKPKKRKPAKAAAKAKPKARPPVDDQREDRGDEDNGDDADAPPPPAADDDGAPPRRKKKVNGKAPLKANGRSPTKQKPPPRPPSPDPPSPPPDDSPPSPHSDSDVKSSPPPPKPSSGAADSDSDFNEDDEIIQKLKAAAKRKPAAAAAAGRRPKGSYDDIYLYPPLTGGVDARVQQLNGQIRKQRGMAVAVEGRRFIWEGFMQRQGRWSVVDRWCFLFSDVFVFAKQVDTERWEMKQFIPLSGMTVDYRPAAMQPTMRKTKLPHPFRLIYTPPSASASAATSSVANSIPSSSPPPSFAPPVLSSAAEYTVSTDTREHRDQWTQRLLLAIAAFHFNTDRSFKPFGWYYHYVLGGIHQAVYDGDVSLLKAILALNENAIDSDDMEGRGVLHVAASKDDASLIPILLDLGADPRKRDRDGLTPLHIAAKHGNLTTLTALLTKDVDFTSLHNGDRSPKQYRDSSAVWLCVLSAQVEWVECLNVVLSLSRAAQRKAIMDDRDDDGQTLLEAACALGLTRAIPVLVKQGATIDLPNRAGLTPLSVAARKGNKELMTALLAQGAQPNLRFIPALSTPLHHATSVDSAAFLISLGARPALKNAKGARVLEQFPSPASHAALERAEEAHAARPAVDTDDPMHPQATTHAQNGGHPLESCVLCQDEFTIVKKRDYCRRCGLNVCQPDSSKKIIFRRKRGGKKERVLARVCDGCYNVVLFRLREDGGVGMAPPQSLRIKKRRKAGGGGADGEGREVSRRGAPSKSKKWDEVDPEEEGDDDDGEPHAPPPHSRQGSMTGDDESYESPVEDGAGIGGVMKAGLKKGFKGAMKVGGFLGGRLGQVFDNVSDGLTNMAIPKGAQRRGGAVNDLPAAQGEDEDEEGNEPQHEQQNGGHGEGEEEEEAEEQVRATPVKRVVKSRSAGITITEDVPVQRGGSARKAKANPQAEGTRDAAARSRAQAAANLRQMDEMEDKAGVVQEEAQSFQGLAGKLKAKARRGQL